MPKNTEVTEKNSLITSRQNLKHDAAKYIRDQILGGNMLPGTRIDQDQVAADLGVSRLPVREALISLEAEGLVENIPRRGAFVAALTPEDILDHYEMYGQISGLAAARCAALRPKELIDELNRINEQMRNSSDKALLDNLNFEFHQEINQVGGSRRLRSVLRMLARSMPTYFYARGAEFAFTEKAFDEHDFIIAAIKAGDAEAAEKAMIQHFRHTAEEAVEMLTASGFWNNKA